MSIAQVRLQWEEQNLADNMDSIPPNVQFHRQTPTHYILQVTGQQGTPHEGANIIVDIDLSDFPTGSPNIVFRNGFKHCNVYSGGKLCMYLTNKETFVARTSLLDIFIGINQVIHNPTKGDPANAQILIPENGRSYEDKMKEQAKILSNPQYRLFK